MFTIDRSLVSSDQEILLLLDVQPFGLQISWIAETLYDLSDLISHQGQSTGAGPDGVSSSGVKCRFVDLPCGDQVIGVSCSNPIVSN